MDVLPMFHNNEILPHRSASSLICCSQPYNKTRVQRVEIITAHSSKQPLNIPRKQAAITAAASSNVIFLVSKKLDQGEEGSSGHKTLHLAPLRRERWRKTAFHVDLTTQ
jgi:hypothetical protein